MYVITYSLRDNDLSSDDFYRDISIFTDEVLFETDRLACTAVEGYIDFIKEKGIAKPDTKEEYGFELLLLGTLWQVYSGDASGLDEVPQQLLAGLARLRKQGGMLKPGIDFIRGIMSTAFLSPDLYDNMFRLDATPGHMVKLLDWLDATGEFNHEVRHLRVWQDYLATLSETGASDILATAITLAAWFEGRSEEVLGRYTSNVERYLNEIRPGHYWREDVIFCGRRRVEYHLNMVGAEIMNRVFRKSFIESERKLVLLPACMRLLPVSRCMAGMDANGFRCACCTEGCTVNKLTRLGRERGFDVMVVPHESSISASRSDNSFLSCDTGVVGVACVLNLVSGGWMLKSLGIPAQCVLLDYCGCKNHWSREGFPTEINMKQLERILRFS